MGSVISWVLALQLQALSLHNTSTQTTCFTYYILLVPSVEPLNACVSIAQHLTDKQVWGGGAWPVTDGSNVSFCSRERKPSANQQAFWQRRPHYASSKPSKGDWFFQCFRSFWKVWKISLLLSHSGMVPRWLPSKRPLFGLSHPLCFQKQASSKEQTCFMITAGT